MISWPIPTAKGINLKVNMFYSIRKAKLFLFLVFNLSKIIDRSQEIF
jgi:hypothetical protein